MSAVDTDPRVIRTREVVVAATADLLGEQGFDRLTIESIAERSGVARSTIYRNWPTRAELFVEAFEQLCSFPEIPDLGSLTDELRLLGQELARGLTSDAWGQALPSLVGSATHDAELADAQTTFSQRRRAVVAVAFERAMDRGEIAANVQPGDLAEQFAAGFFYRRLLRHGPLDDAFIERQIGAVHRIAGAAG